MEIHLLPTYTYLYFNTFLHTTFLSRQEPTIYYCHLCNHTYWCTLCTYLPTVIYEEEVSQSAFRWVEPRSIPNILNQQTPTEYSNPLSDRSKYMLKDINDTMDNGIFLEPAVTIVTKFSCKIFQWIVAI